MNTWPTHMIEAARAAGLLSGGDASTGQIFIRGGDSMRAALETFAAVVQAAERERWQRDQKAWEDTRTQRDELLAHIAGKAPLPQWAADWFKA